MKKLTLSALLVCATLAIMAQNSIDLLTISGRYAMPSSYEEPAENEDGTETALFTNLKVPIVFKNGKTIWFNNLSYTTAGVSNNFGEVQGIMNPIRIHAFILQTGIVQRINETQAIQLLYVPRYMTDFQGSSSRELQHGAIAMFENRWSKSFMMRFGFMYNQELGGPLLVPLFDVNWQMSERWSMSGLFPIYLKVNYQASERWIVGFSHFGLITSYALHGEGYDGDYMERTAIDLTAFARWKMFGNWHLEGRIGFAINRVYAQYDANQKVDFRLSIFEFGEERGDPKNLLFNDGPIAQLRLVYSIPLEDN